MGVSDVDRAIANINFLFDMGIRDIRDAMGIILDIGEIEQFRPILLKTKFRNLVKRTNPEILHGTN